MLSQIILPPPLVLQKEEAKNLPEDLQGELVYDEQGKLFKQYIAYKGFTDFITQSYDNWLQKILPKQIGEFVFRGADGSIYKIENVTYSEPYYYPTSGKIEKLLPHTCRLNDLTYLINIYADYSRYSPTGTLIKTSKHNEFGKMPLCLKSKYCHLYGKTDRELLALGECNMDPGGYFIINGSERTIINQDKLATSKILTFYDTKNEFINTQISFYTYRGPKKIQIIVGKFKQLELHLPFMGTLNSKYLNINIYQGFRLLGITDLDKITQMILMFIKPEHRRKAANYLVISKTDVTGIGDDLEFLSKLKNKEKEENIKEKLRKLFDSELFPNIDYPRDPEYTNFIKAILLAQMCTRTLNYLIGISILDDRDSWSNKRVETPAKAMENFVTALMYKISEASTMGAKSTIANKTANIKSLEDFVIIMNEYNKKFEQEFVTSFASSNWGVSGGKFKENITDSLKRDSIAIVYAQLTQVNAPASDFGSNNQVRLVHPTQTGYICPVQTPDGERAGLVKVMATTAFPTLDQSEDIVITYLENTFYIEGKYETRVGAGNLLIDLGIKINGFFEINSNKAYPDLCTINGIPRGFCNAKIVYDCVKILKFKNLNNQTSTISVILKNEGVEIYTTGSRMTRPLLTVNPVTGNLVKDEKIVHLRKEGDKFIEDSNGKAYLLNDPELVEAKNLTGEYIDLLIRNGALEYIDAYEQDTHVIIAQSVDDIKNLKNTLEKARHDYKISKDENILNTIRKIENGFYTHSEIDPSAIFGVVASLGPLSNHSQGPRNVFECSMAKQNLGIYHSNHMVRYDTTAKVLAFPTRPLFETQVNNLIGLSDNPTGQTVMVAIMTYTGYNIEDGFVFKKSSIEAGLFTTVKYITIEDGEMQIRKRLV